MKQCVYSSADPHILPDLHLVSTRWQIEALQTKERNSSGIGIRKNIATLEAYASSLVKVQPATRAQQLHILRQLLVKHSLGRYRSIAATEGFLSTLYAWIMTLLGEGIQPKELEGSQKELSGLFTDFLQTLTKHTLLPREMLLQKAGSPARFITGKRILITGFHDFRSIELDFLDALAENNYITLVLSKFEETPFTKNRTLRLLSRGWEIEDRQTLPSYAPAPYITAPTPRLLAEAVWIHWLQNPERNTDVVTSDETLRRALVEAAEEMKIPLSRSLPVTAAQTAAGRDLLEWVHLLEKKNPALWLKERMSLHSFPLGGEEERLETPKMDLWVQEWTRAQANPIEWVTEKLEKYQETRIQAMEVEEKNASLWQAADIAIDALKDWKKIQGIASGSLSVYLRDALQDSPLRQGNPMGGLRVLSLQEAANLPVEHRIFVGFGQNFPQTESPNFLVRELAHNRIILNPVEAYFKEKLRLDEAWKQADSVCFALQSEGTDCSVSPLVSRRLQKESIARRATRMPNPETVVTDQQEQMVQAAVGESGERVTAITSFHKNKNHPGALDSSPLPGYTAGALETYVQCPFRYWLDYILKMEEETGAILPARGRIMHEVLRDYYTAEKTAINQALDAKKRPLVRSDLLDELLGKALENAELALAPPLIKDMKNRLYKYIQVDIDRLVHTGGYRVAELESSFQYHLECNGRKILLKGRIDRSDTDTEGKTHWIVDYKTGSIPGNTAIEKGEAFQLPLYSMSRSPVAYVYYGGIKEGVIRPVYMPPAYPKDRKQKFTEEKWIQILSQVKERIHRIDESVHRGCFPVTPSQEACKYCSYASICRKEDA